MLLAYLLGFLLLLTESFGGILILIIASNYESPYFICIMSSAQFSLVLLIAYKLYMRRLNKNNSSEIYPAANPPPTHDNYCMPDGTLYLPINNISDNSNNSDNSNDSNDGNDGDTIESNHQNKNDCKYCGIFFSGTFMALSSLAYVYSANPARTPIIFQLVLNGLNIVYSFLLTRYYLKKNIKYNYTYCGLSISTLMISIGISIIPIDNFSFSSVGWSLLFVLSQIFRVMGNITQEKCYIIDNNNSTQNKIHIITYSRLVQFIVTLGFFWLELFIGYGLSFESLKESFMSIKNVGTDFILLELFIASAILFCIFNGYLNFISANYTTVALSLVSPVIGVFFSIFTQLDNGTHYPIYITIPALALNLVSSYLWTKGETY